MTSKKQQSHFDPVIQAAQIAYNQAGQIKSMIMLLTKSAYSGMLQDYVELSISLLTANPGITIDQLIAAVYVSHVSIFRTSTQPDILLEAGERISIYFDRSQSRVQSEYAILKMLADMKVEPDQARPASSLIALLVGEIIKLHLLLCNETRTAGTKMFSTLSFKSAEDVTTYFSRLGECLNSGHEQYISQFGYRGHMLPVLRDVSYLVAILGVVKNQHGRLVKSLIYVIGKRALISSALHSFVKWILNAPASARKIQRMKIHTS